MFFLRIEFDYGESGVKSHSAMTFNPGSGFVSDEKHLFIPEDGDFVKVEVEVLEGVPVCICTLLGEDIGMGHLLRSELLRDPGLTFVACISPHPQEEVIKVRFHLDPSSLSSNSSDPNQDAKAQAKKVLAAAIQRIIRKLDALITQL